MICSRTEGDIRRFGCDDVVIQAFGTENGFEAVLAGAGVLPGPVPGTRPRPDLLPPTSQTRRGRHESCQMATQIFAPLYIMTQVPDHLMSTEKS